MIRNVLSFEQVRQHISPVDDGETILQMYDPPSGWIVQPEPQGPSPW